MVAEIPETSIFVHFFRKGRVRLYPLVLLEEAVIGHDYRTGGRQDAYLVFTPQSGGQKFPECQKTSTFVHAEPLLT